MPNAKVLVNERAKAAQAAKQAQAQTEAKAADAAAVAETKTAQAKALFAKAGQIQAKIDVIAEYLGLK